MIYPMPLHPLRSSRLLPVVLVFACTASAAVGQQWTSYPPFTLPSTGFRFNNNVYSSSNATLGMRTETSDGFAFLDPTLEPPQWFGDASVDLVFRLRNTRGIRSVTYEFSGGYSFDGFGPRSISTGATITLGRFGGNSTITAGGAKLFEIDAEQSVAGSWHAIAHLDVTDAFGAGSPVTDAWVTIDHRAQSRSPTEGIALIWTDSIRVKVTAVPEPGTASTLSLGLIWLACARRTFLLLSSD